MGQCTCTSRVVIVYLVHYFSIALSIHVADLEKKLSDLNKVIKETQTGIVPVRLLLMCTCIASVSLYLCTYMYGTVNYKYNVRTF